MIFCLMKKYLKHQQRTQFCMINKFELNLTTIQKPIQYTFFFLHCWVSLLECHFHWMRWVDFLTCLFPPNMTSGKIDFFFSRDESQGSVQHFQDQFQIRRFFILNFFLEWKSSRWRWKHFRRDKIREKNLSSFSKK